MTATRPLLGASLNAAKRTIRLFPSHHLLIGFLALSLAASQQMSAAQAQVSPPPATPGDPTRTVPEKIEPPAKGKGLPVPQSPPGSLSDKLDKGEGVIKPPSGIDPGITRKAPDPNPGNMPVIPPPGSLKNPAPVIPK